MFSSFQKLRWFFKKYWKMYLFAVLMLVVSNVFHVLPPEVMGRAIDALNAQSKAAPGVSILLWPDFYRYVGAIIGLGVLVYIFNYLWGYFLFKGSVILEKELRNKLMNKFLGQSPVFYEKNNTGDLMAKATSDVSAMEEAAGFGILALTDATLYMFALLVMMCVFVSWKLTLVSLLPLPVLTFIEKKIGQKIHIQWKASQDAFGKLNDKVLENITGVRVIRAYVLEDQSNREFAGMTDQVYEKNMRVARYMALFMPVTKTITSLSYMIAIGYGALLIQQGEISMGQLLSFTIYLNMAVWPMFAIGEFINVMERANASMERIQETLEYEPDIQEPKIPRALSSIEEIRFEKYDFQYPTSDQKALVDITFTVKKGQTLGIVGKTGAGKTTLIRQFLRQYVPCSEGLLINGQPIQQYASDSILERVGYVPQDHTLLSRSIRDNLLFAKDEASEDEVRHAVELADFKKDLASLPDGLDTLVGEKGIALSGGQKQRISIARALIRDPEVLILDDSLSAVDARTETRIIKNIRRERQGKTTLISTHRLSAVQHADLIVVLEDGRIIQKGSHRQLFEQPGWYREQFLHQQLEGGQELL